MSPVKLFALLFLLVSSLTATANENSGRISAELWAELNAWLDTNSEYEERDHRPTVEFIDTEMAETLRGNSGIPDGTLRGLYDDEKGKIYLLKPWSPRNPNDVGVLLHELVHHRQSGRHWFCRQAQEWRAYQIQAQWMLDHKLDENFYWVAILLESSCTNRDFHPD